MLDIPFYINDGDWNQCMQVAMKSVIKFFLNKEVTLEELDLLTGRKPWLWTRTPQGVNALVNLWLDVQYYCATALEPFLAWESFIRSHFGKDADKILHYTDVEILVDSIKWLLGHDVFTKRMPALEEIEQWIWNNKAVIALIDANIVSWKQDSFQWHYIILTWFDENSLYYHDSWPTDAQANKKVSKTLFVEAWNANGTDNDLVIVSSVR